MSDSIDTALTEQDATAPSDLDAELVEFVRMSELLRSWEARPWQEVQQMVRAVGLQLLAQLTGRGHWQKLSTAEQAQIHWVMADAHSVGCLRERDSHFASPRIASLCVAADSVAVWCGAYTYPHVSKVSSTKAQEFLTRFDALPEGWRAQVIRRAMTGRPVGTVIAEAPLGMNLLRSAYGINVRTP
ncbi:hypothetical protein [Streptomyces sp. NPDC006285]|uniref:hypothetical protein n=1 Tax=Streptomyces sp. NPDC006285 TaxID=3364742 RepID=UPI0036804CD7